MASAPIKRALSVGVGVAAFALVLTGCTTTSASTDDSSGSSDGGAASSLIVGTTDVVTFLDPAASYDNGSFAVMNQVYPFLLNSESGSSDVVPDIAESASFTSPTEYTVKLKDGLTFANGHDLTSSDVKFSFDRQSKIAAANGPSTLLGNLASTAAPDPTTVVFTLTNANDQTFAQVLSGPAGPIVDEEVFSATAVTPDADIVAGDAFAGQYSITKYNLNSLVTFKAFDGYKGVLGAPKTANVTLKYYTDASNMKLDVQQGNIDVAARSFSSTDLADLSKDSKVKVVNGPGGEIRYIVFNFNTQPFGEKTDSPDPDKALAVRQAAADLVDRDAIATQVYKGTYTPLYSYVPDGLTGATTPLKDQYGDGSGKPDADKAEATLKAAGVDTPVELSLQYVQDDHYGPSSADEYSLIKSQLEATGLFKVNLQSTEYTTYSVERSKDTYPAYQLGWFPDFSDADNYLSPFFLPGKDEKGNIVYGGFLQNHYKNDTVIDLIHKEASETDASARETELADIQSDIAKDLSTIPLLQGSQAVVTGTDISGATLDGSFKFRYGTLVKG